MIGKIKTTDGKIYVCTPWKIARYSTMFTWLLAALCSVGWWRWRCQQPVPSSTTHIVVPLSFSFFKNSRPLQFLQGLFFTYYILFILFSSSHLSSDFSLSPFFSVRMLFLIRESKSTGWRSKTKKMNPTLWHDGHRPQRVASHFCPPLPYEHISLSITSFSSLVFDIDSKFKFIFQ